MLPLLPGHPSVGTSGNFTVTQLPGSPTNIAQGTVGGYTDVTGDLYYANGSLGTLSIPAMVLGAALFGGPSLAASGGSAQLLPQTFYVDGRAVSMTSWAAYCIINCTHTVSTV
ncbi:hypothetical protein D1159_17060 [Pseudoflavonifractor sp. 524-17]|uniref:hypothetical protein n=1 Tax=Pseudoflavonifractor sp. 524-17 TaxID=2304577 RepID=UPI0013795C0F|nr:hypothetical protein [Pseudoflavonifractor sp. 524-17]